MKADLFQFCGHWWIFQICWHNDCSTFTVSSFRIWNSSTGIPSPPLALFVMMLSKAHLTSHSRMSGARWVITPLWLSGSWRSFFAQFFCVFLLPHLNIFCLLGPYHFCLLLSLFSMKCSLSFSNFLEEISSLSHSVVFLYFFAMIPEEDSLISPCCSLEVCIQTGISFLFPLLFTSLLFKLFKASSDSHFAFFAFLFLGDDLDPYILYSGTSLIP